MTSSADAHGDAHHEEEDQEEEEEEQEEQEPDESDLSHMTEQQKRLFKLKLKINKGKKANREEAAAERKRLDDPYYESKLRAQVQR